MQDLSVTLVQADQVWEDKLANQVHFNTLLSTMPSQVDLIILPEMFDTGFSMNTELAEEWENNTSLTFLREMAQTKNAAVYTSVMCRENGKFYNRGVFVYPNGDHSVYDKRKTFGLAGEDQVFTAGNTEQIIHFKGWNIQLQICYDLRFPEICRNRLTEDKNPAYDLLIYVANWPERRSVHWKTLLQARAIENQCYVIGVNRVGKDGKELSYSGDSACITALGEATFCEAGKETMQLIHLSQKSLQQIRTTLPFLKDR
jgi:omega-amidase